MAFKWFKVLKKNLMIIINSILYLKKMKIKFRSAKHQKKKIKKKINSLIEKNQFVGGESKKV